MLGAIVESKLHRRNTNYICFCNIYLFSMPPIAMTFCEISYVFQISN